MERTVPAFIPSLVAVIIGLAMACTEAAERKDTRPMLDPPPPAKPQNVTVPRGGKIDVPLKIYGVQNEALRYLIKTQPAHGKLSEPRPVTRESWTATYEPPADLAVKADRFTFSVQNHAGVSAPVEVTISIVDQPPRLAVPHTIEFGELLAGASAVREIEIANRGGGLAKGEVEVDPPFKVEGRKTYQLEGGDYTYIRIVFAPSEGGLFKREIRYTSDPEFITSLVGSAQTPISVEPTKVELRNTIDSAARTGAFEIVNRTAEPLNFQLKGTARLQLAPSVAVAANARVAVAINTRADDVADLNEEVRVESEGFSLSVPVHGFRLGPILRTSQRSVAMGRIDATRGGQASLTVQNVGGSAARVTTEVGVPFALSEPTFDLPPGATKQLTLTVKPSPPKRYRTWLKFKGGTTAEVEVDAELMGDAEPTAAAERETKEKETVNPADLPPWMPNPMFARAVRIASLSSSGARIEWPVGMDEATQYRLERMMLTRDSAHRLRNAWVEIPKVTVTRLEKSWAATLTGLQPQQSQTVRVVAVEGDGKVKRELFRLDFSTPPAWTMPKPRLVPSLLTALFISMGLLFWKRLRRQFSAPLSGF